MEASENYIAFSTIYLVKITLKKTSNTYGSPGTIAVTVTLFTPVNISGSQQTKPLLE